MKKHIIAILAIMITPCIQASDILIESYIAEMQSDIEEIKGKLEQEVSYVHAIPMIPNGLVLDREDMKWQERITRRYAQGDIAGALKEQAELDSMRVSTNQLAPVRRAIPVH